MEPFADLSRFLISQRLRTDPGVAPRELALAAGIDADRYNDIEDGRAGRVALSVLDALASALRLEAEDRGELFRLGGSPGACRLRGLGHLTRAVPNLPVVAFNHRFDITGWNLPGQALLAWGMDRPVDPVPPNLARMLFLDPATQALYGAWQPEATRIAAALRRATRTHADEELNSLIVELGAASQEFAALWSGAADGTRPAEDGSDVLVHFEHPAVGGMTLSRAVIEDGVGNGQRAVVFSPEPGSGSAAALEDLLTRVTGRPR